MLPPTLSCFDGWTCVRMHSILFSERRPTMRKHALLLTTALVVVGAALPSVPVIAQEPSLRIVYTRSTGEFDLPEENEIFIMNADGSDPLQLTDNAREDAFPNLSPDGTQVDRKSTRLNSSHLVISYAV